MRFALIREAEKAGRAARAAKSKDERVALAKRQFEAELRAAGFSHEQAKLATSIRFRVRE